MSDEAETHDEIQGRLRKALGEIVWLHQVTEDLQQTCDELNLKVTELKEDHSALKSENEHLSTRLAKSINDLETSRNLSDTSLEIQEEARREMAQLREDNKKLETEHKLKMQEWERKMREVHSKAASVEDLEEELVRLRDENDVLRQAAEKVTQYERTINVCKRKLEQLEDIKATMRQLEDANNEAIKKNFKLEAELKESQIWKDDLAEMAKELTAKQQKLLQETQRAIKAEFEAAQYREKFENAQIEIEKLQEENVLMRDTLEATQLEKLNTSRSSVAAEVDVDDDQLNFIAIASTITEESFEFLNPATRQKLLRLEMENEKLKEDLDTSVNTNATNDGAKILVAQLRLQEEELAENFLKKEQELLEMKKSYEGQIYLLKAQSLAANEKLKSMETQVQLQQYRNGRGTNNLNGVRREDPMDAVDAILDSEIPKKDVKNLPAVHEMEEKLLASAFYTYGLMIHRNTTEMRNKTLLHRHRMTAIMNANQSSRASISSRRTSRIY